MPESQFSDQDIIDGEHDCRERVPQDAEKVGIHEDVNILVEYECDVCGRSVYEVYSLINMQVEQLEGEGVMEPRISDDGPRHGELHRVG